MIALDNDGRPFDTYTDSPELICPYCKHHHDIDSETFSSYRLDDAEQNFTCEACGRTFTGTRTVNIVYETFKTDGNGTTIYKDDDYD